MRSPRWLPGLHRADPSTPLDEVFSCASPGGPGPRIQQTLTTVTDGSMRSASGRWPASIRLLADMSTQPSPLVLVASNRGPVYFLAGQDGTLSSKRGGGGMVSGLTSGLSAIAADGGVLWVCAALSDADRAAVRRRVRADGGPGAAPVRMLDIPQQTFEAAYNQVSNSVLWFVHHLLFDTPLQPRFGAKFRQEWAAYTAYNEAFAAALAEE